MGFYWISELCDWMLIQYVQKWQLILIKEIISHHSRTVNPLHELIGFAWTKNLAVEVFLRAQEGCGKLGWKNMRALEVPLMVTASQEWLNLTVIMYRQLALSSFWHFHASFSPSFTWKFLSPSLQNHQIREYNKWRVSLSWLVSTTQQLIDGQPWWWRYTTSSQHDSSLQQLAWEHEALNRPMPPSFNTKKCFQLPYK